MFYLFIMWNDDKFLKVKLIVFFLVSYFLNDFHFPPFFKTDRNS